MDSTVLLAACVYSAVGALVFNAFPLFLSATANQFGLNDAQLGFLGTSYLLGFAAVALVAPIWIPRVEWRPIAIAAGILSLLALLALLAELSTDNAVVAYSAMAVIGVASSTLFTIGLAILTRAVDVERAFGIKFMYEMAFAGVLVFVMTKFVIGKFGFTGFIAGTGILYLASLLFVMCLPRNFMRREAEDPGAIEHSAEGGRHLAWASVAALFFQFAAFTAIWGFMERIGVDSGVGAETVGSILSLSILAGFGAALIAAVIGNKYGHVTPLATGLILSIAAVVILETAKGVIPFAIAACVVFGMFNFTLVYQMGLIAHTDNRGKIVMMIPFIAALGGAIGPGIAGGVIESSGFTLVYIGFTVITVLIIGLSAWIDKQAIDVSPDDVVGVSQ